MPSSAIPDQDIFQREIKNSHARCLQLGVNPGETLNPRQKRLTPEELEYRLEQKVIGIIFVFSAIHRIRKLINEMAGSQASFNFEDIIGCSPDIMEAKRLAMLAASGNSTVLILGETGTGKELFAQSIHNLSTRKHHPFVAINCGAIPRELLERELFGYTEGSFTGAKRGGRPGKLELASSGTLFLDEIGDMPVDMQVKFLRVLQTGDMCRIGQHKPIVI